DDNQISAYLETANAYSLSNIRWVLDKIETYKNPAPVILDALNIEHIMPQTQNEYWQSISHLDLDDYINVVNQLGNLTLASSSDNSKMGNKDFDHKKQVLEATKHLKLNEEILKKTTWTVDDIKTRTEELTGKILNIFPYVKTSYVVSVTKKNRYISMSAKGIKATGYLNEDHSLTVYADSQVKYDILPSSESLKDMREEFLEQEIVVKKDQCYYLTQNYTFNSPSTATDFILGGSNNGWIYWKDDKDQLINDSLRND
ncbi:MAG: DUF4357 domain-containing protein, partial [Oscillospiraceae bacterium]